MSEISPTWLLHCDGQAFGHLLTLEMEHKRRLTPAAKFIIKDLRDTITTLLESPAEHHAHAVRGINGNFDYNDRLEYDTRARRSRRIGEQGILEWLKEASDREFLKLARWNVERRESLHQQLAEDHDGLIETALSKASQLVDLGFFPTEALDIFELATETYSPFAVMDSFESGSMHANGYFDTEVISIANLYELPFLLFDVGTQLERTVFHELLHASGYLSNKGFHFNDTPVKASIWEEAFVAHSTAVAYSPKGTDPQPSIYDPTERIGDTNFTYGDERQIMGHLSSADIGDIPADLWANAFFDGDDNHNQHMLAQKLRLGFRAISSSENAFETFNKAYEETWSPYDIKARSQLLMNVDEQVYRFRGIEIIT